jgi:transcriptional regulator with XRE-family HTH domain
MKSYNKNINNLSTSDIKAHIIMKVNELVHKKMYTQIYISERCGITRQQLHRIMKGKAEMEITFLLKLAEIHNERIDYFICDFYRKEYPEDVTIMQQFNESVTPYEHINKLTDDFKRFLMSVYTNQLTNNKTT